MTTSPSDAFHNRTSITDAIAKRREPGHQGEGPIFPNTSQADGQGTLAMDAKGLSGRAFDVVDRIDDPAGVAATLEVLDRAESMLVALGYVNHARVLTGIRTDIAKSMRDETPASGR